MDHNIVLIGGGNLGSSIIDGILSKEFVSAENVSVVDTSTQILNHYLEKGVHATKDALSVVKEATVIILAVKPWILPEVLKNIGSEIKKNQIVVSTATFVSLDEISDLIESKPAVFRVMPNTAASVKESLSFICSKDSDDYQVKAIEQLFSQIGKTILIEENQINAATALSASGIAYFFRFMRAMEQGGVQVGFNAAQSREIVLQTAKGAITLLEENGNHPEEEIDRVTTPKGSTITALNTMEKNGLNNSVIQGIIAAYEKLEGIS